MDTELGEFALYMACGATMLGILVGPIGRSVARWIESKAGVSPEPAALSELIQRVEALEARQPVTGESAAVQQHRMAELEERVDFAERLLTQQRAPERLVEGKSS